MSKSSITSFHTLPVELFYRILDQQNEYTIVFSMRNICRRFNRIVDSYDRYQTLTEIQIKHKSIEVEEAKTLGDVLSNTTINRLDLQSNAIEYRGARYLADGLKDNKTLTILQLGCNKIGYEGAQYIANMLKENTTLTGLELESNEIKDEGARFLAGALKTNTTLIELEIWGNEIGNDGVQYIADTLSNNRTLTHLDLGRNSIGDQGLLSLAPALQSNGTRAIRCPSIRRAQFVAFFSSPLNSSPIQFVAFSSSRLNENLLESIEQLERLNQVLSNLTTRRIERDELNGDELIDHQSNTTLIELNLRQNCTTTQGEQYFMDALGNNRTLKALWLQYHLYRPNLH
ncbi:unnamed protein product [Adineta ricciae]|uniref:F-box domain-containing protein n=1 Tax=Adineta ricciae TaxID=249248 RepID=A0A814QN63_ADIRI|nr:unnamed protein product [Adineta ricciae]